MVAKNNGFLLLKVECDSKSIIDCFNKRTSVLCSIWVLMKDIWKLCMDLNIYSYHHVYREANGTVDYHTKKDIDILDSRN